MQNNKENPKISSHNPQHVAPSTTEQLSPDLRFLMVCCQSNPSEADTAFIHSFIQHPTCNIQHLLTLSSQHGILPLVYKTIKKQLKNQTIQHPTSNIQDWQAAYQQIAQRNMLMSAELIRIMKLLEENNIQALAFKGPTLAQMAYGDITLRQYGDLDILVDEKEAFKAAKLMTQNGHDAVLPLRIVSNKICLDTAKDFSLMSKGGVHTELHWRLFEKKFGISILSCTKDDKCQTVTINKHPLQTLQNEILLVYLCRHGAKHAFERIEWICDIDRIICNTEINWNEAIAIAEESHSKRAFYLALSLSQTLFSTPLSEAIQSHINTKIIGTLQDLTLEGIVKQKEDRGDFKKNRETFFYQSRLFDKRSDMLRFYLSTFFKISTTDCQTFTLPAHLKFLYIVLRPIRLLSSYISRIFVTHST